ncbi:MAG: 50S ribosomal protein L22 [Deltaproteobacteria bacterium]|nr:50S ribosomal protein L22 [Deltaproteobacteria bacterium]
MAARATLRHVRMAPRKLRVVADMVRGRPVEEAVSLLTFTRRAAAPVIRKLLVSAVANAEQDGEMNTDDLVVRTIMVDQGPTMKRWRPRAQGRAFRINKKTSHVTVELDIGD